jgi:putative endonuclease
MSDKRLSLGHRGEHYVAERLQQAGYVLRDRNWRHTLGELDIVAQRELAPQGRIEIVFVEVRTRRGPLQAAITWALESVSGSKQARLLQLAEAYLSEHDLTDVVWRIDVAAVGCEGNRLSMEVIQNAVDW